MLISLLSIDPSIALLADKHEREFSQWHRFASALVTILAWTTFLHFTRSCLHSNLVWLCVWSRSDAKNICANDDVTRVLSNRKLEQLTCIWVMSGSNKFFRNFARLLIRLLDKLVECWCQCFGCRKKARVIKVSYYHIHIIAVRVQTRLKELRLWWWDDFFVSPFRRTWLNGSIIDWHVQLVQDYRIAMQNQQHSKLT